jgi:heme oxygenase
MLRAETQVCHEELDQSLDLTRASLTRSDYIGLLKKMYGFHLPIEVQISGRSDWHIPALELSHRIKVPQIRKDLLVLGVDAQALGILPLCAEGPSLESFEELLGCMYVLEGSTLGGQVLKKHFQALFQIDGETGCSYYSGYGPRTREMWSRFVDFLNSPENDKTLDSGKVVTAAVQTFRSISSWLKS